MTTTSFLEANLAAHRARWGFASSVSGDRTCVRVEPGPGAFPRVSLRTADGRWLRVHSDRQPMDEATRWIEQHAGDPLPPFVCIVGAGYGYVLDALEQRAASTTKFLVLEPEPEFLSILFDRRDWTALIEAGRLMVLTAPHYEGRANAWRLVTPTAPPPAILQHAVISAERPEATKEAAQVIGQAIGGARANDEAHERFGGRYLLNTVRNLPMLARARDVGTLFGTGAGRPAIVAGAGPSLNRNLEELAQIEGWRDRAVVIAVDTALKPMLAAGLQPHYVVGVDPSPTNARMLSDLPPGLDTALVAEASLSPPCFEAFTDRTFVFKVSDTHHPWPWLNSLGVNVARLRAWGSVLTTAFDLALALDCNPVTFIGADLSYREGQPYARNTVYEADWAVGMAAGHTLEGWWRASQANKPIVRVDINGEWFESTEPLVAFRDWLVAQTTETRGRRFVNATGHGILTGPCLEQATLSKMFASVPRVPARATREPHTPRTLIGAGATLTQGMIDVLRGASAPGPEPIGSWKTFTRGRMNSPELILALSDAWHDVMPESERMALIHARRQAVCDEARQWLALESTMPQTGPAGFHTFYYARLTQRRLEHLASLNLPLRERHVLEVGAGLGDMTEFFLDRRCRVHTTDVRPEHVSFLRRRFAPYPLATVDTLGLDPPPESTSNAFDVVLCYSVLNYVSAPDAALDYLSRVCSDLLLVEAVVTQEGPSRLDPVIQDSSAGSTSFTGRGCLPNRAWLYTQLRERFTYVYVPMSQPNHPHYPLDWSVESPSTRRAIFVASRRPMANPSLVSELPQSQYRH